MGTRISDPIKFRDTVKKAIELGGESKESFFDCLKRLNKLRKSNNYNLQMVPDFVKYSWSFAFHTNENRMALNGGMILHGFEQTFSVEINGSAHPHWSIHT